MRYRYYICDVFTEMRFGGNPLAVLPEAEGLSDGQMQRIAREFNFSESAFVLPSETGHTRRVRIFTPTQELPFAGHPNIGTAYVLAATGQLGEIGPSARVTFEEGAGLVPIAIRRDPGGSIRCELAAPEMLSVGEAVSASLVASAVSLSPDDVVARAHPPQIASVGLPFLVAEVANRTALERARVRVEGFEALAAAGVAPDVHLYTHGDDEFDLRTRMFAPLDGIPEDPATGSANCALAGLLAHCAQAAEGSFHWRIAQGVEMGRPSALEARAEKKSGAVVATWIGGASVLVGEGSIEVD